MRTYDVASLLDDNGDVDPEAVCERIDELVDRAAADVAAVDAQPDRAAAADRYLLEGVGATLSLYVLLRTGGRTYRFNPDEYERLERAFNTWLELYGACHGVDAEPDASLRTGAELLLETADLHTVARTLVGIPDSSSVSKGNS